MPDPEAIADQLRFDHPQSGLAAHVRGRSDRAWTVLEGEIRDSRLVDVGDFRFRLGAWNGRPVAHLGLLALASDWQGRGFARAFVAHAEAVFAAAGAQAAIICAENVGAFTWARCGYEFRGAAQYGPAGGRDDVAALALRRAGTVQQLVAAGYVREVLADELAAAVYCRRRDRDHPDPAAFLWRAADLAAFGEDEPWTDEQGRTMWLGKAVMLGACWQGEKRLGPPR